MPRIMFTSAEVARIDAILQELDPDEHELVVSWRRAVSQDDWAFLTAYIRSEMRASLEMGMLARSLADKARDRGLASEDGISTFLATTSWLRNFGMTDDADERFMGIAGPTQESPLFMAVEALLEIAKDRLFGTFDDEYRLLLEKKNL